MSTLSPTERCPQERCCHSGLCYHRGPDVVPSTTRPGIVQMMGAPATPSLQFLRLLRVLRLQRYVADYESFLALEEGLGLQPVGPFELEVARVISSIFTLVSKKPGGKYSVPSKEDFVL